MQLKHVPLCFLILASICLAGAVNASASSVRAEALQTADIPPTR